MGTPEFGVKSLEVLAKSHHKVVGVVTNPDRPSGRGNKIPFLP
jgi:methionyl-tRNA formyltransferase